MHAPHGMVATAGPPRLFVLRIAIVFCAPMLVNGIALPFFPIWLNTLSMTDWEIGVVLAVPMVVRVFTAPIAGMIADRIGDRASVLVWSGAMSLATAIALLSTEHFWPVLILYTLQGIVYAPYLPITDAIALSGVRRWHFDYSRMRFWGSLAFIVSTMIGGWLAGIFGGAMVLPAMTVGFITTVMAAFIAPRIGKPRRASPISALPVAPTGLAGQMDVQLMMLGAALVNASHGMFYAFSAILWGAEGFSGTEIGLLFSVGVAAEVLFFIVSARLCRRFSLWTMIVFGSAVAMFRWVAFPHDLGFFGYFALQSLHAFTFAAIHVGVQGRIIERLAEEKEASTQGLYFFYNGIFMALTTFLSGYLFAWYGIDGFYAMSVVAALGLVLVLLARSIQPQRMESGGNTNEPS
ncbi:PPP family 3-phenylpropionic acid transporter [Mycoplana sp. BE70]|uniref:MFS transporter n=1 Tax=Mycoplana sp. BE70 TaxID=2817775 RepID=UPI0028628A36|nr:MFS transporter [Mycoplana sp. BE70]MDR6758374.1 PPP family 3-phenylpropionic acid transporter [Mycoplana sp. BE70]